MPERTRARALRLRLREESPVIAPGVWDAVSAQLAREAGFETAFIGGTVTSASWGMPDMSLLTLTELLTTTSVVIASSELETIVDLDTGYGGPAMIRRAVMSLARLDAAGFQIEDQLYPRRWNRSPQPLMVPTEEMLVRIRAARSADQELVLIARTDALEVEGLPSAIARALAYRDAGADLVWVNGITSFSELERVASVFAPHFVYNIAGTDRAPRIPRDQAQRLGVALVLYPMHGARAAARAVRDCMARLAADKPTPANELMTYQDYVRLSGWEKLVDLDRSLDSSAEEPMLPVRDPK